MWKSRLTLAGLAIAVVATASAALAADSGPSQKVPVTKLIFVETGVRPLQEASTYGDLQKGEHATHATCRLATLARLTRNTMDARPTKIAFGRRRFTGDQRE